MPTPFGPDGSVDHGSLDNLSDYLAEESIGALVTLGIASETRALGENECAEVVETVVRSANVRMPVLVGLDGFTDSAARRAAEYRGIGAAGLMLRPPPGCSGAALVTHVAAIADASQLPIMIQNAPLQTGVDTLPADLVALTRAVELVFSVKEESAAVGPRTRELADAGVDVFVGLEGANYPDHVLRGAAGCVPGLDLALALVGIDQNLRSGQIALGLAEYAKIAPLMMFKSQSLDLAMHCQKRYFKRMGIIACPHVRAPAKPLDKVSAQMCDWYFDRIARLGVAGFAPELFAGAASWR